MKNRIKSILAASVAVGALAFSMNASALPIRLDVPESDPSNQGAGTVETWLQGLVTAYNTANNPDLPSPVGTTSVSVDKNTVAPGGFPSFGNGVLSITLPMGSYDYLVLHWGGNTKSLDTTSAWYIGSEVGALTFNAPAQNGLSGYRFFHPETKVADGGSTLLLLGSALTVLRVIRRRNK